METTEQRRRPVFEPEEIPADAAVFPMGMLLLAGLAFFFSSFLPWWKPLVWWILVFLAGAFRIWYIRKTKFNELSERHRVWLLRGLLWTLMATLSSACYFLYVPSNPAIQALWCICGAATTNYLVFCLSIRDPLRAVGALTVLIVPTGLRLFIEGIDLREPTTLTLGCIALLFVPTMAQLFFVQTQLIRQQIDSQIDAERTADAMATVALTKSRFFAAISHDLRQPVHAIGLYVDQIARLARNNGDAKAQRAVAGIAQAWQILNDLLSQVLDIARLDATLVHPELAHHDIASLVEEMVLQHSPFAESVGVRLVALVGPHRYVLADKVMLQRVLANLITNAVKFSPAERSVVIAVRSWRQKLRIQVRDAGCGIALSDQTLIFEEFAQLDHPDSSRHQGLGLGLAIAKRLTELQGGTLSVRSLPNAGCCMTILMPKGHAMGASSLPDTLANQFLDTAFLNESRPARRSLKHCSVLLVEDDPLVGHAMAELMAGWGIAVDWETTVEGALANTCMPDMVICDWRLPGKLSGWDLALRFKFEGKRVMMVTGETDEELRAMASQEAIPLLIKPVAALDLYHALLKLL